MLEILVFVVTYSLYYTYYFLYISELESRFLKIKIKVYIISMMIQKVRMEKTNCEMKKNKNQIIQN